MPSGGPRPNSGPPPDPNAFRRERAKDAAGWTVIDRAGRRGAPPPDWPLTGGTAREKTIWAREWRRPQALKWEELGLEDDVAFYVRAFVRAERPKAPGNARTLVRQYRDELGISLSGMLRLRWKFGDAEAGQDAAGVTRTSAKDRGFKVITGGRG